MLLNELIFYFFKYTICFQYIFRNKNKLQILTFSPSSKSNPLVSSLALQQTTCRGHLPPLPQSPVDHTDLPPKHPPLMHCFIAAPNSRRHPGKAQSSSEGNLQLFTPPSTLRLQSQVGSRPSAAACPLFSSTPKEWWKALLSSLLWTPSVLHSPIPIPKCQVTIPRKTFYLEPTAATSSRTP